MRNPPPLRPQPSIGSLLSPEPADILSSVERLFDNQSRFLAENVESVLRLFGRPNAYIVGNDISGGLVVGGRYGTGALYSAVAAPLPIRWRAATVGLGLGASYGRQVMLIYGIDAIEDIFGLYAAVDGSAHLLFGANVSIVSRGSINLVMISSGLGLRLTVDVGGILIDRAD